MDEKFAKMWKMGSGNSGKRFSGENPIPEKTEVATKDSWKTEPMPEKTATTPINLNISKEDMSVVKMGHIPDAMEDHWFMYCDDDTIRYYRSWTGFCIFIAKYKEVDGGYLITELEVNRDPSQYTSDDIVNDKANFLGLLVDEFGGDSSSYWEAFLNK